MLHLGGESLRKFVTGLGVKCRFVVGNSLATEPGVPYNHLVPRTSVKKIRKPRSRKCSIVG
jgi:hypothetical protein